MKNTHTSIKAIILLAAISPLILLTSCYKPLSETTTNTSAGINGSFEQTKNNLPVNWLCYTNKTVSNSDFDLLFDTVNYAEGKQSLKFDVRKCSDIGGNASPGISQEINLTPGKEYKITCWIKNTKSKFRIKIDGVDELHQTSGPVLESSDEINAWQKQEFKYKLPNEMKRMRVEISVLSPGTFWIDNITVVSE